MAAGFPQSERENAKSDMLPWWVTDQLWFSGRDQKGVGCRVGAPGVGVPIPMLLGKIKRLLDLGRSYNP